jgi:hypothetical protein
VTDRSRQDFWDSHDSLLRAAAAIGLVVAAALWVGPALLRADLFEDDATQHIWWLYRYADPALFRGDVMVDYFRTMAPLGYRAIYGVAARFVDALLAAKWLGGLLYLASGWLAWKIGASIGGKDNRALRGLLVVVSFVVVVSVERATAEVLAPLAFQRTFSLPILLLCLSALIAHRYRWVGASWVAAALLYPAVLPLVGLMSGCAFLRDLIRDRRMPDAWVFNSFCAVAAVAAALFGVPHAGALGPAFTYSEAIGMPEYGPNGRLQLHLSNAWLADLVRYHTMGLGTSPWFLVAVTASVFFAWWRGKSRLIPFAVWAMLGTGLGLWALLRLFPAQLMFGLYLPNRHSKWAIAVFAIVAFAAAAYAALELVVGWMRNRGWRISGAGPVWALSSLSVVAMGAQLWPDAHRDYTTPVDSDLENIYAFISRLPKDTLVAAHPTLADDIPLRTRRSVLTSTETSMPWLRGYYAIVKPRVEASLRAAYATDVSDLDAQLAPYGVDVFVTGPMVWSETKYLEPYDHDLFQALLARGRSDGFALRDPPADRVLYRSGDYYVLSVRAAQPRQDGHK